MKKLLIVQFLFFSFLTQSQIGQGVWQDHLSINSCFSVARLGTTIYAANYNGLVRFPELEFSPEAINKINGLSDVGVRLLRANPYNNKLLVVYQSTNIDIIDENKNIINYPDIKLKTFNGKKVINEITFQKEMAYMACGFGIVLFDTEKLEIKETFFIGPNGSQLEVYQVAINDSLIFAATPIGLYKSNYKLKDLNNYNNWVLEKNNISTGPYVGVVSVEDKILAGYSPHKLDLSITGKDSLYILQNNVWSKYPPTATSPNTIKKMGRPSENYFSVLNEFGVLIRKIDDGSILNYITSFNSEPIQVTDFYFGIDSERNYSYWVSDFLNGVYQTYGPPPNYKQNKVTRNGVNRALINSIDVFEGQVAISPSHPEDAGGTNYIDQGLNVRQNSMWTYFSNKNFSNKVILDITYALIDRTDKTRIFASGWADGLLEYKDNKLVKVYSPANTSMPEVIPGNPRCTGLSMDADGNLWVANSDVPNFLSVLKKSGEFQTFKFDAARFTRKILVDKNNYVWAIHERDGGITVFKHNNFSTPVLNSNYKVLNKLVGNGNLGSNAIFSIAEDKSGRIWVGTSEGVRVFYNPTNIFSGSNFDAQPIKITQDGNVELLLGNEVVTSIVVDGADNKWMATQTGGLYCFSPDGLKELYHFTKENSPLYSNEVIDINYDEVTGDIFIGTDIGIQSYRSSIIEGAAQLSTVFAYPNPVRPNYTGKVFIRGLTDDCIVKIVDESGSMVWETKSTGGQIAWPVTDLSGNRAVSGVYVVYAMSTDGEQRALTKILIVN